MPRTSVSRSAKPLKKPIAFGKKYSQVLSIIDSMCHGCAPVQNLPHLCVFAKHLQCFIPIKIMLADIGGMCHAPRGQ